MIPELPIPSHFLSLEDLMKDRVTIGLGRYKVCDELYENCCRKYEEIVSVAFIKE